jgi:cyclohexanone monooxygenase
VLSRGGHGGDPLQKLARHHNALVGECDRRLRRDANVRYVEVTADFRHYIDDPHVDPDFTRKMAYTAPGRTPSSPS